MLERRRERDARETERLRDGETPTMKTVFSLHRKWAHAVETIRILQGIVSVVLTCAAGEDVGLSRVWTSGNEGCTVAEKEASSFRN